MYATNETYRKKDFWAQENTLYAKPNFRSRKCAQLVNEIAAGKQCDLLDVGCGPAAMRHLLDPAICYHGIDIALHDSAPCLRETDFIANPIDFDGNTFDLIVALGVIEYVGGFQAQKLSEIKHILKPGGTFIMSYLNFSHFRRRIYPIYNNVRPIRDIRNSVAELFHIDRMFPVSHHWRHKQPGKYALPGLQLRMRSGVPLLSRWLAVEYFLICSQLS